MGCCEGRDMMFKKNSLASTYQSINTLSKIRNEAFSLGIKTFDKDTNLSIWGKIVFVQEMQKRKDWKPVFLSTNVNIHINYHSKFCRESPITRISMSFNYEISLKLVISAICEYESRKKWDTNLLKLEVLKENDFEIMYTLYEYFLYKPEFFEEKIVGAYHNSVIIGLQSVDCEHFSTYGTVPAYTYFSFYVIKEKAGRLQMTIFSHINPNLSIAVFTKKLFKQRISVWTDNLKKYLDDGFDHGQTSRSL